MGPSGSGKTTPLNMCALTNQLLEKLLLMILKFQSKESKLYETRREKIGFIFQSFYLIQLKRSSKMFQCLFCL